MKIVHTEASMGFGGQELRILNEMRGMAEKGHQLTLICSQKAEIFRLANQRNLDVTALPIEKKGWSGFWSLSRWLKDNRPDVVNTHSSVDSWLVGLACYMQRHKPAIIRTRHISAPISKNFTSRWLYNCLCDHVVTTGENLRQTLVKINGLSSSRVTSVRTGIDLGRFKPGDKTLAKSHLALKDETLYIGIVATLRSWKGHRFLLEAFSKISVDDDVQLVIVGDGPQENNLKQQAKDLNVYDRVIFAGRQGNVDQWLQAMDIFCLPSYANEGVPQSLMQAQACGLPVITTRVGSIEEAIVQDKSALIVKAEDVDSLKDALNLLINDQVRRLEMGAFAAKYAVEQFSEENMLDSMERIFKEEVARITGDSSRFNG